MQISDNEANELYMKHENLVRETLQWQLPNHQSFAKLHGLDKEDLLQLGRIGLFKATKVYDSSKGASFKTYAKKKILFTIITEAKKYSLNNIHDRTYDLVDKTSMECPVATTDGDVVDLHDIVESKNDTFDEVELEMMLSKVSDALSEDVAEAVKMRYQGYTFEEIGDSLGLTKQRVQKLLKDNRRVLTRVLLA